jgi:prepilin-type processing-associated H-X9-DG protein
LDAGIVILSGAAALFVSLTRFAVPVGKPKILRFGLLTVVAVSVFVFASVVGDVVIRVLEGTRVATWPLAVWSILIVALLGAAFAKYRGHYDVALRRTLIVAVGFAFGLSFLGSQMGSARPTIQRVGCKENLEKIGKAFRARAKKEGRFREGRFPPAIDRSGNGPPQSWRVTLLPEISDIQSGYDSSQPWDAAANLAAARTEIEVYSCPAVGYPRDEQNRWLSPFALVTGPGTIFPGGAALKVKEITDGTSSTLLAVEAIGLGIVWSEPRDFDVSRGPLGFNLAGAEFGRSPGLLSSYHPHLANVLFADGSARMLSGQVDPKILKALTTAAADDEVEVPTSY